MRKKIFGMLGLLGLLGACTHSTGQLPKHVHRAEDAARTGPPRSDDAGVLATLHPHVLVDPTRGRLLVRRDGMIAIVDVITGQVTQTLPGVAAQLWAADGAVVLERAEDVRRLALSVIDAATLQPLAECEAELPTPAAAGQVEPTVFGYAGSVWLRWESFPPPAPARGTQMTDAERQQVQESFAAAWACGVHRLRVAEGRCVVESARPADAGLYRCDDAAVPRAPVRPSPVGDVELSIGTETHMEESMLVTTETLVASSMRTRHELWRHPLERHLQGPPPP